jgi:hypothetical protein
MDLHGHSDSNRAPFGANSQVAPPSCTCSGPEATGLDASSEQWPYHTRSNSLSSILTESPVCRACTFPFAQRNSIVTFWPSTKPASFNPRRNAANWKAAWLSDRALRYPIMGVTIGCAQAPSGEPAAPATSGMTSRRLMCRWPPPGKRKFGVQHIGRLQSCVRPVDAAKTDCWPPDGVREPRPHHSITSSARARSDDGTSSPSALAVLRLITSSYLVGACTGRSAGFSPLKMRST